MTDLSNKAKVTLEKQKRVSTFALSPDGKRLAVLLESEKDAAEKEVPYKDIPKDLRGIELEEFKQRNDGKTSQFFLFSIPSGEKIAEHKVYFSNSGTACALFQGEQVLIVNYSNVNAAIGADGSVKIFQLDNSFNYGIGIGPDQKVVLTGGLRNGTYTQADGLKMHKFSIDQLPGWPEYFKGFAVDAAGTGYGATTGYRLIQIQPDGKIARSVPVH
jgi:hypothetical protein